MAQGVRISSASAGALLLALAVALMVVFGSQSVLASKDDKYEQIKQLVSKDTNVVAFTSMTTYNKFVVNSNRNYDIFVMLSASKSVGCNMCGEWEQAFIETAQAAQQQIPNEKIIFGMAKFDTLPDAFRLYNLNYAPLIIYVAHDQTETKKIIPKLTMNLANLEAAFPDPVAQFVTQRSGRKVEIFYSPWPKILTMLAVLFVLIVAGRRLALIFVPILRRYKWIWFIVSLVLYGLGVSGSIYSYLRNVPNHGWNQKTKKPEYFAGDRAQYFYEGIIIWGILVGGGTFIVASAYGKLPSLIAPFRPFFNLLFLGVFGVLFKTYVTLYLGKAQWYRYGMSDGLSWPWISK